MPCSCPTSTGWIVTWGSYLAPPAFCQVCLGHLPCGPEAEAEGTVGVNNRQHPSYTNT